MDAAAFVGRLGEAVPEARDGRHWTAEEPLPYLALADARQWIEDHALAVSGDPATAAVRVGYVDLMRRFWEFVETEAQAGQGDRDLENLLQIECFEGVPWVEDLIEFVGPRTRELLVDAQTSLAPYNRAIGRWPDRNV